ncbi:MAG TPA: winged helix-turn-helix domain-containing protein [Candidatus Limnocylindrales bacterium]|jgi:DNA-binding transcriptional ArsR family regulator|nr:winged helix-turn-helix domain-containing protein [Candidatus Limnocylindrales bacterium]
MAADSTPGKRPATQAEARALSHPLRMRIIRLCLDQPLTNREIAARLKAQPATVLYHVRTLERTGFLVRQPERRGRRGAREIPYLSTRKSMTLELGLAMGGDVAMLDATRAELIEAGPQSVLTLTRLGVRVSAADRLRYEQRIIKLVNDLRADDGSGDERVALMVLLHRRP